MNPRLRSLLHRYDVSVTPFSRSPEARRPKIFASLGIDTVLDIGANQGQWATLLRGAGYRGRILSFEPVGSAYAALAAKASRDPRWDAYHVAVAAEPGESTMNVSENSVHSSMLVPRAGYIGIDPKAATIRTETVPADTLDDLVARYVPDSASVAVKIDVQGYETQVLDGGPRTIERARVLEMELLLVPCYEGETMAPELLARVFGYGFALSLVENVMQDEAGRAVAINGIFVRP